MTIPERERLGAMEHVLRTMLEDLGDQSFETVRFAVGGHRYGSFPHSIWAELQGFGFVVPAHAIGEPAFRLTGAGWIAGLQASGAFDTDERRARMVVTSARVRGGPKVAVERGLRQPRLCSSDGSGPRVVDGTLKYLALLCVSVAGAARPGGPA